MALARTLAVTLAGITGRLVEVEADVAGGVPGFTLTGLPDTSVSEARDRVRAAVINSGVPWPVRRITVALLPADLRKVGSGLDLAVAVAVLAAARAIPAEHVVRTCWLAELGLDGKLRPVRGVLPAVAALRAAGVERIVVAPENGTEAALVDGMDVRVAATLQELIDWLRGEGEAPARPVAAGAVDETPPGPDLADVSGQTAAKRALEIAAAGLHHVSLVGAPGAGKTMLAERLPGILPPLPDNVALELTAVHSVAGLLHGRGVLLRRPPLQAPHHTASTAALIGGGSNLARPGAVSLAHGGVLFLDEAAEFRPHALDALRQPMESGRIVLHRSGGAVAYPAHFLLVLAANPCPCGSRAADCTCPPPARRRYQQRLSGPLLDRIDLRVEVDPVPAADLFGGRPGEGSASVAERVAAARAAAVERWRGEPWDVNGAAAGARLRRPPWALPHRVLEPAETYLRRGELSARGFDRVLRLAWTVADLAGATVPDAGHVGEALYYRTSGSSTWAA